MITATEEQTVLRDHVDMRLDRNSLVQLDPDHPGFRDQEYRARRNQIAQIAMQYQPGNPIPDAPYTDEEHQVWRAIWQALRPAQHRHACAEYLSSLGQLSFSPDRIP